MTKVAIMTMMIEKVAIRKIITNILFEVNNIHLELSKSTHNNLDRIDLMISTP